MTGGACVRALLRDDDSAEAEAGARLVAEFMARVIIISEGFSKKTT